MPLAFGANVVEGRVYRSKKKQEGDDEKHALRELQTILSSKNRKACDCECQIHDLLENCLGCGRLTCEAEGPGKCLSCGNIVLNQDQRSRLERYIDIPQTIPSQNVLAKNQTNSLRTNIIDNQFDHFAIENKRHLREEDKKRMIENLEDLQTKRYQRKLILNVDIDSFEAGSHSVPQIDDYDAELRRLQLDNRPLENKSNFNLADLVAKEHKINYNYEYFDFKEQKNKPIDISKGVVIHLGNDLQKQKHSDYNKSDTRQKTNVRRSQKSSSKKSKDVPNAWENHGNKDKNK